MENEIRFNMDENAQEYCVWVGESEGVVSFHAMEGYERKSFATHDEFVSYLNILQSLSYRFQ